MTKYTMTDPLGKMILKDEDGNVIAEGFQPKNSKKNRKKFQEFLDQCSLMMTPKMERLWGKTFGRTSSNSQHGSGEPKGSPKDLRPLPEYANRVIEIIQDTIRKDHSTYRHLLLPNQEGQREPLIDGSIIACHQFRPCLMVTLNRLIGPFERPSYTTKTLLHFNEMMDRLYLKAREVCLDYQVELLSTIHGEIYQLPFTQKGDIAIGKHTLKDFRKDTQTILAAYEDLATRVEGLGK